MKTLNLDIIINEYAVSDTLHWTDIHDDMVDKFGLQTTEEIYNAEKTAKILSKSINSACYLETAFKHIIGMTGNNRDGIQTVVDKLCDSCVPKSPYAWVAMEIFDGTFSTEKRIKLIKEIINNTENENNQT